MSSAIVNLIMITLMITEGGLAVGAALAPVIVMIIADEAGMTIGVLVVGGSRGVILVQDRINTGVTKTAIIGVILVQDRISTGVTKSAIIGVILFQDKISTGATKTAIIGVAITAASITAAIGMVVTEEMEVVSSPGAV